MLPFSCWLYGPETWSQEAGSAGGASPLTADPSNSHGLSEFPQLDVWAGHLRSGEGLPSLKTQQQHTNELVRGLPFSRVHIAR